MGLEDLAWLWNASWQGLKNVWVQIVSFPPSCHQGLSLLILARLSGFPHFPVFQGIIRWERTAWKGSRAQEEFQPAALVGCYTSLVCWRHVHERGKATLHYLCSANVPLLLQKGEVHAQQGWLLAGAGIGLRLSRTPQLLSALPLPGKSAAKGLWIMKCHSAVTSLSLYLPDDTLLFSHRSLLPSHSSKCIKYWF